MNTTFQKRVNTRSQEDHLLIIFFGMQKL